MALTAEEDRHWGQTFNKWLKAGYSRDQAFKVADAEIRALRRRQKSSVPTPPFMRQMGFKL